MIQINPQSMNKLVKFKLSKKLNQLKHKKKLKN